MTIAPPPTDPATAGVREGALHSDRRHVSNAKLTPLGVVKLRSPWTAREAALGGASRHDLVAAKAGVVEAELAKLGLHLHARSRSGGRRVLQEIYEQGHQAGLDVEYTPGIGHERWWSLARLSRPNGTRRRVGVLWMSA